VRARHWEAVVVESEAGVVFDWRGSDGKGSRWCQPCAADAYRVLHQLDSVVLMLPN
jgi:hypothetical protein